MARKPPPPRGPQLDIAGDLGVAFVNTGAARDKNRQQGIANYAELLAWSQQVGVLQAHDAERLAARATSEAEAEAARAVYAQAERARRAVARLFIATQLEKELPADALSSFNEALAGTLPAVRLTPAEQGVAWGFAGDADALDRMLWAPLFACAQLLIAAEGRPHVRQCAAASCGLFFVDRSPSRQRRWCEMKTCGNRVKSLRHYRRVGKKRREDHRRKVGIWRNKRPRKSRERLEPRVKVES